MENETITKLATDMATAADGIVAAVTELTTATTSAIDAANADIVKLQAALGTEPSPEVTEAITSLQTSLGKLQTLQVPLSTDIAALKTAAASFTTVIPATLPTTPLP